MNNRFELNTPITGFLPVNEPMCGLLERSALDKALNNLLKQLPVLIRDRSLRSQIDAFNMEYASKLNPLRGYVPRAIESNLLALGMLAQAYIFENPAQPVNVLPAILSEQILQLSSMTKRLPVLTYSNYILNNWQLIDKYTPISLENIKPLFTFTGSVDEEWFINIHVAIEAACHHALIAAKKSLNAKLSLEQWIELYELIANSLSEARIILLRMKEHCQPDYFYHILRPFLSGWETVKTQVEGREESGIRFQRAVSANEKEPLRCYRGSSGAQSGILPAFDAFLNIKQENDPMHKVLQEFQAYMRPEDRALIACLGKNNIQALLQQEKDERLVQAVENATKQQALFRMAHISIVHQFIYAPAKKLGISSEVIKGTGGTPTEEYLGKRAVVTQQAAEQMRARL